MCLTTPATKTGFANVFVASPPKKGGEFQHFLLVGCGFPSKREIATPEGWRTGLCSGFAMTLIFLIFVVKSSSSCALPLQPQKLASPMFLWHPLLKKKGEFQHFLLLGCGFPSKREIATPRGLSHRAMLGVRNDTYFIFF